MNESGLTLEKIITKRGHDIDGMITRNGFRVPQGAVTHIRGIGRGTTFDCHEVEIEGRRYAFLLGRQDEPAKNLNYCWIDQEDLDATFDITGMVNTHLVVQSTVDQRKRNIAMLQDYVPGIPLSKSQEGAPYSLRISWLSQLLRVVEQLGEENLVHRDIKPANAIIFGYKMTTIDVSMLYNETKSNGEAQPEMAVGTVAYMSPEQARGEPLSYQSDLFSWGATSAEVLDVAGFPFSEIGSDRIRKLLRKIANRDIRPSKRAYREIPRPLRKPIKGVIDTALHPKPWVRRIPDIRRNLEIAYERACRYNL